MSCRELLADVFGTSAPMALRYTCAECETVISDSRPPLYCPVCGYAGGVFRPHCIVCDKFAESRHAGVCVHLECISDLIDIADPLDLRSLLTIPVSVLADKLNVSNDRAREILSNVRLNICVCGHE